MALRLSQAFEHEPLLIAYICAGDPSAEATVEIAQELVKAGADVLELGMPFSDPIADGPVIQAASQRALEAGMTPDLYFSTIAKIRVPVPLVFMGYYNLIFRRGLERFLEDCRRAGISGLIVPDLPLEESGPLSLAARDADVDLIMMVAPNTPEDRIRTLAQESKGFIYLVARSGVTGMSPRLNPSARELISRVPSTLPRAVGFGISTPAQAAEVIRAGAEAAIVGSACVDRIAQRDLSGLYSLVREMKAAVKGAGDGR